MKSHPFIGISLALALGIHLGHSIDWQLLFLISFIAWLICQFWKNGEFKMLPIFFFLGVVIISQKDHHIKRRLTSFENNLTLDQKYYVQDVRRGKKSIRLTCIETLSRCKLFVFLSKDLPCPLPGDSLKLNLLPEPICPPIEVKAFDFQAYAHYQDIQYAISIYRNEAFEIIPSEVSCLSRLVYQWKTGIEGRLEKYLKDPLVKGLAIGILLGDKSMIPEHLENTMSSTGTLHVMAVSGLHVGIICAILMWLMGRSGWWPLRVLKLIVCLAGVWTFVLITGGRPSAIRAATMFSLYIIGWTSHLKSPPLNILAAGAFFILCSNPYLLYQVSFQLSVSAVASILLFYPMVVRIWNPKSVFMKAVWTLSAMSISVQILVGPVSVYYFHSFPLTFLPANLIAIPMATVLMITSIMLVSLSTISHEVAEGIGSFIEGWTNLGLSLLNTLTETGGHTLEHLWPNKEVVLIFMLGAALLPLTATVSGWLSLTPCILIVGSVCIGQYQFQKRLQNPQIISYPRSEPFRLDINNGKDYLIFSPEGDLNTSPAQSWIGHGDAYHHHIAVPGDTLVLIDSDYEVELNQRWVLEEDGWSILSPQRNSTSNNDSETYEKKI